MATSGSNIVSEWLRSLHLGQYADSFIDNGYDDLEICKQVGDPDLDAIGVFNPVHRNRLLQSVRTLREEGAASVYFNLEESVAVMHEECFCADNNGSRGDNVSARSSRTTSSGRSMEKDAATQRITSSPAASSSAESGNQEIAKYLDEYEEGKAELVKIPRMQLKVLLREKLNQDGIRLNCQPYTTPVLFPTREQWAEDEFSITSSYDLEWYTDGSHNDSGVGAGVFGCRPRTKIALALGKHAIVFQAEIFAILSGAQENSKRKYRNKNILICTDSQAAIMALSSWEFKSKIVWECLRELETLANSNKITLAWVPGHSEVMGNEQADILALL